jgi:hypothetical protein
MKKSIKIVHPNKMVKQAIKTRSGDAVCKRCHAVYFDKFWHTDPKLYAEFKARGAMEIFCGECKRLRQNDGYGGEVILKNIVGAAKAEIMREIKNIGDRASRRDPEDRIIKIEDNGGSVRIITTENQLALSLGRQIAASRKGGKLQIKLSKEDKLARVVWTAK